MRGYPLSRKILLLYFLLALVQPVLAQAPDPRVADFKKRVAAITAQRRDGAEENEAAQESALKTLDGMILDELNSAAPRDIAALNRRLAGLVAQEPPLGESYALISLGATPSGAGYYALVVNMGVSGPSALRLYPPSAEGYKLAARIDRYAQRDFFDDYLEVVPIKASDVLFVTVSGRTDELKTGVFAAWRFKYEKLEGVWASEPLEFSSYEYKPDGFHIRYCVKEDEDNPRRCALMARERHLWDGSFWRLAEREEFAPK